MDKGYLDEFRILEQAIDVDKVYLNYEDTFTVLRDFIRKIILDDKNLHIWKITDRAKNKAFLYLEKSKAHSDGIVSAEELTFLRVGAWNVVDVCSENNSKLFRLILLCLSDKQHYLDSIDSMPDNFLFYILFYSYQLDTKLGELFREFVINHPCMQKYKIYVKSR